MALVPALGLAGVSEKVTEEVPAASGGGDWCFLLPADYGVVVDDPEARWVQYLQFGGYLHHQSAFVDGESGGQDFWYGRGSDWRRGRLTFKAKTFDALSFLAHANMVQDEGRIGGGSEWDYHGLFLAWAELDLKKLAPVDFLDSWSLFYGKRKLKELSEEVETSINSILTVERSALAGQISPFRAATGITGVWTKAARGKHNWTLGLYTTDASLEFGTWSDGIVVSGGWNHDFGEAWGFDEARFSIGGAYQDVQRGDEVFSMWEWVVTPWLRLRDDRWELRVSGALGQNEGPSTTTGGDFYGITVIPAYWLLEQKLQAVLRYQVMASEAPRGVGMAARYAREAGRPQNEAIPALSRGTGDFHQSLYAGLAWYPCPKRLHVLGGVEWDQLESRDVEVYEGLTGWLAVRLLL